MSKTSVPPVQQKKRPPHLWKKGQSGNPSGRIAFPHELRMAFQEYTQQSLDTLVKALDHPQFCVKAAEVILARGWGPVQAPEVKEDGSSGQMLADFSKLSDKEWQTFKELNAKVLVKRHENEEVIELSRQQKIF